MLYVKKNEFLGFKYVESWRMYGCDSECELGVLEDYIEVLQLETGLYIQKHGFTAGSNIVTFGREFVESFADEIRGEYRYRGIEFEDSDDPYDICSDFLTIIGLEYLNDFL